MHFAAMPPSAIEELAHDTLIQADQNNLTLSYAGVLLRVNVCSAYLRAGDLAPARELLRPVTRTRPDVNTADAHLLLGAVELREGHVQAALERCRAADAQVRNRNQTGRKGYRATPRSSSGPDTSTRHSTSSAKPWTSACPPKPSTSARHCSACTPGCSPIDSTRPTRPQRNAGPPSSTFTTCGHARSPTRSTQNPLHAPIPAMTHLWRAELARIDRTATIESWVRAATAFDRLTWPHDAAYCRWRAAQVAQRTGEGTLASRLLNRAAADARTHVPLSETIAATGADA